MNTLIEKLLRRSNLPLSVPHSGHRRPLEMWTNGEPWLSGTEAHPALPRPLRVMAGLLIALAAVALVLLLAHPAK